MPLPRGEGTLVWPQTHEATGRCHDCTLGGQAFIRRARTRQRPDHIHPLLNPRADAVCKNIQEHVIKPARQMQSISEQVTPRRPVNSPQN